MFYFPDIFGALLRGGEPVQEAPDLHGEDYGEIQGHQTS